MHSFFKHTIFSLVFIAGLIALLLAASQLVVPKNDNKETGIQDPLANGILEEKDNTIDVLFIGDSESYCSFIPLKFWKDYGISSYVCGTSGQTLPYSETFLHKTFAHQNTKIVILETDAIFRDFSYSDVIEHKLDLLLPVFSYHNRWKSHKENDVSFTANYTYIENTKGYVFNNSISEANDMNYMKPSGRYAPIPPQNRSYVKSIKSYCEENGAKLILVSTPSTINWNSRRHNSVQELAENLGLEYIDMNLMRDQIAIDWKNDTRDRGDHLNYNGAEKVSAYLGKYLADSKMPDHRGDERYHRWDVALKKFNKVTVASQKNNADAAVAGS